MTDVTLDPPLLDHLLGGPDPTGARSGVRWAVRDGERVVVKFATGRDRSRLRREAEALRHLRSARVVELLSVHDDETTTSLVLADFGHRTLADPTGADDEVLLRALHRCCEAVAELHRRGWTHGNLAPEHVLLGARGSVRLCALADARSGREDRDAVARDVDGLVDVVRSVAAQLHRRGPARGLRRLADEHSRGVPASAAELAERVQALRLQGRWPIVSIAPWRALASGLRHVGGSATAKVAAAGLGAALLVGGTQLARAATLDAHPVPARHASTTTTSALTEPALTKAARTEAAPTPAGPEGGAAPTVTLDGSRYRVGLPGDLPVVGDWDCDGSATVRLLRPATGELFEFTHAPAPDQQVSAELIASEPGAVTLRAEPVDPAAACHRTVVTFDDGTERTTP